MADVLRTFALLLVGHVLADYPLQGDFLLRAKNRFNPIPGVPWYQALGAHALIQGAGVGFITNSFMLGVAEFCMHAVIDDLKCAGKLSFNADQALHVLCKIAWLILIMGLQHD